MHRRCGRRTFLDALSECCREYESEDASRSTRIAMRSASTWSLRKLTAHPGHDLGDCGVGTTSLLRDAADSPTRAQPGLQETTVQESNDRSIFLSTVPATTRDRTFALAV